MKIRKSVKRAMHLLQIEKLRRNQLKPINEILDGHDTIESRWPAWQSLRRKRNKIGYSGYWGDTLPLVIF